MNQTDMILEHLQKGNSINQTQASTLFGCTRLPARISDLKKRGMEIDSKWQSFNHSITGKKGSFKNYFLKRELPYRVGTAISYASSPEKDILNNLAGTLLQIEISLHAI